MLGAIVGDIVGSIYERRNIKTKDFPLFGSRCSFTDDTVMTCAVAEVVMNGGKREDFVKAMKKYGRLYPNVGYGGKFRAWLFSDGSAPYGSFGNGSAMRVSPCAWAAECDSVSKRSCPTGAGIWRGFPPKLRTTTRRESREQWQQSMRFSCVGITSGAVTAKTNNPSIMTRLSAKDSSGSISSANTGTTFPKRSTKSARHTALTLAVRAPCRRR